MQPLTKPLLRRLAGCDAPLCLSLFLEVTAGGGDHKLIRVSLKNAKTAANRLISGDDEGHAAVRDRLGALDHRDLAGARDRRVAVFIAPDLTEVVDARFQETGVHAGRRFRLAPLVGDLDAVSDHAILVASEDAARLYRASNRSIAVEEVEEMPGALAEVSGFTDQQEKGAIHGREDSGAPGVYKGFAGASADAARPPGVPHHSMGGHDWREDRESDLQLYANRLAKAVGRHLGGSGLPLVIVADERLNGMIRRTCSYPFLAEDGVLLHPRELDEREIREAAAACLGRKAEAERRTIWDRIAISLERGDGMASTDPEVIATAAASGRVDCLFLRGGATVRGRMNEQTLSANIAADGPEDLIDLALSDTLRNGGDVGPIGDLADDETAVAASFRRPA